jgi:hypothetical protein
MAWGSGGPARPIPFSTTMTPATTREYKEKGSHDELRIEHHNTREWNKDKKLAVRASV